MQQKANIRYGKKNSNLGVEYPNFRFTIPGDIHASQAALPGKRSVLLQGTNSQQLEETGCQHAKEALKYFADMEECGRSRCRPEISQRSVRRLHKIK